MNLRAALIIAIAAFLLFFSVLPMSWLVFRSFWSGDGAKVQAYIWNDKGNKWLTAVSVTNNVYKFEIPDGYTNLIFCRMNPNGTASDWSGVWNQTENLTVQIGKTYTVNSWNNPAGSWA